MENERTGYLYRHIRKDKDEVFYIGMGVSGDNSYKRAHNRIGRNEIWNRITNKTDYDVEIMLWDVPFESLREKEKEFIKIYGKIRDKTGSLANITDGGEGTLGYSFPSNKRGKTFADIVKDEEYANALIHNSKKPFILKIKEPDKETYNIRCGHKGELFTKTGLGVTIFKKICDRGQIIINKMNIGGLKPTRHKFPKGTIISVEYEKVEKIKINRPIIKKKNIIFDVIVTTPTGDITVIRCNKYSDFKKVAKMDRDALMKIRIDGKWEVKHRQKSTKHPFPVGSVVEIKYLDKIS